MHITLIEEQSVHEILETSQIERDMYAIKAILQTTDTVNKNKRIYPTKLLSEEIENIRPIANKLELLGELDHPFVISRDPYIVMRREHIVMYDRASHLIKNVEVQGNKIIGSVQTLKTPKGKVLSGLIASGVPIGFSLRAFGRLVPRGDGVVVASKPFKIITWDAVSNPSHSEARMIEITEDVLKETIYTSSLMEGVAMDRMDALIELINDDYSFLESEQLMGLISRHFDILMELI